MKRVLTISLIILLASGPLRAWNPDQFKTQPVYVDVGGVERDLPGWELLQNGQPLEQVPDIDMRLQAPFEYTPRRDVDLDVPDFKTRKAQPEPTPPLPMLRPEPPRPATDAEARLDSRPVVVAAPAYRPWSGDLARLHARRVNSTPRRDPLRAERD